MVTKNRSSKNNLQRNDYEIKPDLMLFTQNRMLPNLKSVPPEVSIRNVRKSNFVPTPKQTIVHLSKQKDKSVLSFLQEPLCVFQNNAKQRPKVYRLTYDKSKIKSQKYTNHNKSESLKTSICDTIKNFYKTRQLQKTKDKPLPFPNTIAFSNDKRTLHEEITNYNKNPSVSILKLSSSTRRKEKIHDQLYAKIHSCTNKQILLYKTQTTSYSTNSFLPVTTNISQEKQSKCTSYINPTTSNPDHIQNKDLTKTSALTLLRTRTCTTNDKSSSVMPLDQSTSGDTVKPNLCTDNYTKTKDANVKDKMHFSCSEQMVKTTNYDKKKKLEKCHPKVINQSTSLGERNVKRSMSAIHCTESTQCMYDIKNNISDLHIPTDKCNSQKNKSRFNVQYSSDDIDWTSTSERNTYLTSKFEKNSGYDCKIKYSWQVIGTSVQTSNVLLYNFFEENQNQGHNYANKPSIYKCDIKYSWQIIGTGTQVSLQNTDNTDYWTGIVYQPNIRKDNKTITNDEKKEIDNDIRLCKVQPCGRKFLILNNQYTQTLTEKETQSDFTDCKVKYSWQNLVWQNL